MFFNKKKIFAEAYRREPKIIRDDPRKKITTSLFSYKEKLKKKFLRRIHRVNEQRRKRRPPQK